MKTVVQKLINKVDAMISNGGDADLLAVKVHLENSLETEKEQIIEAYMSGKHDSGIYKKYSSEDYYQQTFKAEE